MIENTSLLRRFLGVYFNPQTYRNLAYLFLSFPLGLIYFIVLVTGFSLGFSLVVIGIGIVILAAMVLGISAVMEFERTLNNSLLDAEIPPQRYSMVQPDSLLERIKISLSDGSALKGLIYLFARFPFGIFGFVLAVMAVALPFSFIFAPFTYTSWDINVEFFGINQVDNIAEALFVSLIGLISAPFLMHFANITTSFWREFSRAMLGGAAVDDYYEKRKSGYVTVGKPKRDFSTLADEYAEPYDAYIEYTEEEKPKRTLGELVEQAMQDNKPKNP